MSKRWPTSRERAEREILPLNLALYHAACDAGNLQRVVPLLGQLHQQARLVICGDDDPQVKGNPGRQKAEEVAQAMHAVAVFPQLNGEAA